MPLPANILKEGLFSPFLTPDNDDTRSRSKELGGISIGDSTQGLLVRVWVLVWNRLNNNFIIFPEDDEDSETILFSDTNVTELSLSFDSNMRPSVAYTSNGVAKLRYYDTLTEDYSTLALPNGSRNPRLCHDDKRPEQATSNNSDVCLFYLRDDKVYYRVQRERYEIENQIATLAIDNAVLTKVGMSSGLRVQLELEGGKDLLVSSP
jgi:hypothetical protein